MILNTGTIKLESLVDAEALLPEVLTHIYNAKDILEMLGARNYNELVTIVNTLPTLDSSINIYIIKHNSICVGCVYINTSSVPGTMEVHIGVFPPYRQKGIARFVWDNYIYTPYKLLWTSLTEDKFLYRKFIENLKDFKTLNINDKLIYYINGEENNYAEYLLRKNFGEK